MLDKQKLKAIHGYSKLVRLAIAEIIKKDKKMLKNEIEVSENELEAELKESLRRYSLSELDDDFLDITKEVERINAPIIKELTSLYIKDDRDEVTHINEFINSILVNEYHNIEVEAIKP